MPNKNEKKPVKKMNITLGKKGRFDPSKYINVEPTLKEAKRTSIVISFGRMNPITVGHEKLVNKVISESIKRKADAAIYLSHTQDKKKNPLSYDSKIEYATKAFGKVIKRSPAKTIIEVAKELSGQYDSLILVVGSDRISEFETLLNKYNGKEFNFDSIDVISAGERDPDSDDVSGMSASKLRNIAAEGNLKDFTSGLPKKLQPISKSIYDAVRKGLGMNEEFVLDEAVLSITQRRRRGLQMRRLKNRLKIARKKAKKRMASKEKLQIRARRKARTILRNRLAKKPYSDMSPPEKIALDKRLSRIPPAVIDRIARKQLPTVRTAERERLRLALNPKADTKNEQFEAFYEDYYAGLSKSTSAKRKAHFEKGKRMDDDNPAAYKPAPGDARAKTKPSIHTKRFKQMFGEQLDEACERDTMPRKRYHMALEKNGSVKFDKRFKFFKKNLEESNENILEDILDLQESVESYILDESSKEALKNKAEKTGISYGILKKVYDRGVAAWRTGHRPGTTPAQWGMARVNSFATKGKGTWGKADSDLAARVRKEEVELDEKACWTGYKQLGMKKKGKRIVPNCVKEEVQLNSFFDLNERFELLEASILDKALAAIHKHVMGGEDLMDVVWQVSRAREVNIPGKQLYTKYIEKFGDPGKKKSDPKSISALKRKYGLAEQENVARAKLAIAREKQADKEKHARMLDSAAARDKSMREDTTAVKPFVKVGQSDFAPKVSKHIKHHLGIGVPMKHMVGDAIKAVDIDNDGDVDKFEKSTPDEITGTEKKNMTKVMQKKLAGELKHTKVGHAFESVDKSKPENREYGTDSLVKILKGDTPGQEVKESALNDYIEKGARVKFTYETMTDDPKEVEGIVVGTDPDKGRLRVRDNSGKLYIVKHEDVELTEATQTRGFEGKMIKVKNVPVRMADGTIKSLPPSKSASSSNGNGD